MFDILCTANDIASTLSHQTTLFMISYPLHASHHTPVSDIAPTVSLSSQPLHWCNTNFWMTSHPPSVWHPMTYIEHHILSLCHHSTVLTTSQPLYLKAHPVCRATYSIHMRHHSLYLCPHTHCIDNITCILGMTSHSPYVASFPLCKTSHPHFMTSSHRVYVITATIFDILSTVSVTSHPLYWLYHTNCNSEITSAIVHNIISIVYDMAPTVWHHNHCFHGMRFPAYHITSRIYDMSSPIAVTSQKLCCEYM